MLTLFLIIACLCGKRNRRAPVKSAQDCISYITGLNAARPSVGVAMKKLREHKYITSAENGLIF